MRKKGDISQVFIYIITGIIMVAVLGFGVRALLGLIDWQNEMQCVKFKEDLKQRMQDDNTFGVVDKRPLEVDCEFRQICFVDLETYQSGDIDTIVDDSVISNAKQNVFFRNSITEDFYYVENMVVEGGYICKDATNGAIEDIGFKGLGGKVFVFDDIPVAENNPE